MDTQNPPTPGSSSPQGDGYQPVLGPAHPPQQPYGQPPYGQAPYSQQPYGQPPYGLPRQPPPYGQLPAGQPAAFGGLTDNTAGALAYITLIPAIIFLVVEPYNQRPFVKFNAFQCLFMYGVMFVAGFVNIIPLLGQIIFLLVALAMLVLWVICIVNASQGKIFKVPVIGDLAAKQAGLI